MSPSLKRIPTFKPEYQSIFRAVDCVLGLIGSSFSTRPLKYCTYCFDGRQSALSSIRKILTRARPCLLHSLVSSTACSIGLNTLNPLPLMIVNRFQRFAVRQIGRIPGMRWKSIFQSIWACLQLVCIPIADTSLVAEVSSFPLSIYKAWAHIIDLENPGRVRKHTPAGTVVQPRARLIALHSKVTSPMPDMIPHGCSLDTELFLRCKRPGVPLGIYISTRYNVSVAQLKSFSQLHGVEQG